MGLSAEHRGVIQRETAALAAEVTSQIYGGAALCEALACVNSYSVIDDHYFNQTWAGRCQYAYRTIQMNLVLCTSEDRYRGVLAHEYAHAVAEALYGTEGMKHGPRWQNVMVRMDRRPEQFHRFNAGKQSGGRPSRVGFVSCMSCGQMVQVPSFALGRGVAARCPGCGRYAK
jgi:hypothetical protein